MTLSQKVCNGVSARCDIVTRRPASSAGRASAPSAWWLVRQHPAAALDFDLQPVPLEEDPVFVPAR